MSMQESLFETVDLNVVQDRGPSLRISKQYCRIDARLNYFI